MSVFRVNKNSNYTTVSNYHLRDRRMSLKAKGLLTLMLSLPDSWDYSIAGLVKICKENETAVKSALSELKECGYLIVTKYTDEMGRFVYDYNIYEKPNAETPGMENPPLETPGMENNGQLNTNQLSTEKRSTEEERKRASTFDEIIASYTSDASLANALIEYVKMRKLMKKPLTDHALRLAMNTLDSMASSEPEKVAIVNNSILNGWQGLFPLKEAGQKKPQARKRTPEEVALEHGWTVERAKELMKRYPELRTAND